MLDRVDFQLTAAQVSDFVLGKDYTNFLNLQQAMSELADMTLIEMHPVNNRTYLQITQEGIKTLHFFENRISPSIKKDIHAYFTEKEYTLREETSVLCDYYKATTGDYEAHLVAKERGIHLIDITLSVPSQELAASICDNWQRKNQEIYQYLISQLF